MYLDLPNIKYLKESACLVGFFDQEFFAPFFLHIKGRSRNKIDAFMTTKFMKINTHSEDDHLCHSGGMNTTLLTSLEDSCFP